MRVADAESHCDSNLVCMFPVSLLLAKFYRLDERGVLGTALVTKTGYKPSCIETNGGMINGL